MSKIQDPTILFQYRSTTKLAGLLEGIKQFVTDNSKESLFDFFDIDAATGAWLDQLGAFLNVLRPYITADDAFIMDSSLMDGEDLLDGAGLANDDIYKTFIKAQILKRNSRFSIEEMISLLQFSTGAPIVYIKETVKTLSIYLGASEEEQERIANLLGNLDRKWFGMPSGVVLDEFLTVVLPDGATFFIMDSNETDNANFLMI